MFHLMLSFLFLSYVFGGSLCPPRVKIYPCICINKSIGKSKLETTVICRSLENGNSFKQVDPTLSQLEINKFLLYDSYWPTSEPSRLLLDASVPVNHVSYFKAGEIEVVDTTFSYFGCPENDNCGTSYLKKYTAINSTVKMSEGANCANRGLTINAWISCPASTEQISITYGFSAETTLKPEFFSETMNKLKVLQLSHNNIARIDRKTFSSSKFPVLESLDLSYNQLKEIRGVLSGLSKLKYLDLSHNQLKYLFDLRNVRYLHTLKINDNELSSLAESDWNFTPSTIRHVDLLNNQLECNCGIKWINSTFHINTQLHGSCISPSEVVGMKLRRASRLFIERCDEKHNLMPSKIKKTKV